VKVAVAVAVAVLVGVKVAVGVSLGVLVGRGVGVGPDGVFVTNNIGGGVFVPGSVICKFAGSACEVTGSAANTIKVSVNVKMTLKFRRIN